LVGALGEDRLEEPAEAAGRQSRSLGAAARREPAPRRRLAQGARPQRRPVERAGGPARTRSDPDALSGRAVLHVLNGDATHRVFEQTHLRLSSPAAAPRFPSSRRRSAATSGASRRWRAASTRSKRRRSLRSGAARSTAGWAESICIVLGPHGAGTAVRAASSWPDIGAPAPNRRMKAASARYTRHAPEKAGRSPVAATRREESPGSTGQGAG